MSFYTFPWRRQARLMMMSGDSVSGRRSRGTLAIVSSLLLPVRVVGD
jgi:hypothetical protein